MTGDDPNDGSKRKSDSNNLHSTQSSTFSMSKSDWWLLLGAIFGVGGFLLFVITISTPSGLMIIGIIVMFIGSCCINKGYETTRKEEGNR